MGSCEKAIINKLQTFQNQILRIIDNMPRFARLRIFHENLNIAPVSEFIRRHAKNSTKK